MTDAFDALLSALYEAPLAADGFAGAAEQLRRVLGAGAAGFTVDQRDPDSSVLHWSGLDEAAARPYESHYFRLDPWREANATAGLHVPILSDAVVPRSQFRRSEFGDFCAKQDVRDFAGVVVTRTPTRRVVVAATFPTRLRTPSATLELLARLAPHAARAVRLHSLRELQRPRRASLASAVRLDRRGRVVEGDPLPSLGDGLGFGSGGVLEPSEVVSRGLAAVARGTSACERVARPSGKTDFLLVFAPVGDAGGLEVGHPAFATVHIVDPAARPTSAFLLLQRAYGLTRAEARVAVRVGEGQSAREVAEELHVGYATVRSQLLSVFAKTGVGRQSALARLVSALSAVPTRA